MENDARNSASNFRLLPRNGSRLPLQSRSLRYEWKVSQQITAFVRHHGQTPCLLVLLLRVAPGDLALAGVVQLTAQEVDGLALVQLSGDLAAVGPNVIPGGVGACRRQGVRYRLVPADR